jgi:hypothetical protein
MRPKVKVHSVLTTTSLAQQIGAALQKVWLEILDELKYDPVDDILRTRIADLLHWNMHDLWLGRKIADYNITCDDTNNTAQMRDAGQVQCYVTFRIGATDYFTHLMNW